MKQKVLIVDLNNVWNRYLFVRNGDFTQTLRSVLHLFRSIYRAKEFHKVYVVIDGKPCEKYEEYKEYKHNRKHNPDKYIPLKVLVSVLCQHFEVVGGKQVEGDEVIGYIATRLNKKYETCIFSNDKDFIQLMQYNIKIITSFKTGFIEALLTEEEALKKFINRNGEPLVGLHNVLPYRVFKGDSSDGIPPACYRMKDTSIRDVVYSSWIHEVSLTEELLHKIIDNVKNQETSRILYENKENILRNFKLMNLCYIPDNFKNKIVKIFYHIDVNGLEEYIVQKDLWQW